jgi:3-dehydroquinate synthase
MQKRSYRFSNTSVDYYFSAGFALLKKITNPSATVLITDEHIYKAHASKFKNWNTIILEPGEEHKVQSTVDDVIEELIAAQAGRTITIVGVGGGVVTDLTGYIASIYMRGVRFGFVPTSLLGMVDASIGGKNGIDVGLYKNMVGTIRQPSFLLQDMSFLDTLPEKEWYNGFAEIIKHASILDAPMFRQLETASLDSFRAKKNLIGALVQRNAVLKTKLVQRDEFEKDERRLLNFGHTLGHALEKQYDLVHGQAVAIGMTYACHISEKFTGFNETDRVVALLEKYGLPTYASFDKQKVFDVLKMDKKRQLKDMNYVLLEKIGRAVVKSISLKQLEKIISSL